MSGTAKGAGGWRRAGLVAVVMVAAAVAFAGEGDGAGDARVEKYEKEIVALYGKKKYALGAAKCRTLIGLFPKNVNAHYNLACGLARMGKADEAMQSLTASVELGLVDPDLVRYDEDLESLRAAEGFEDLVAKLDERLVARDAPLEKLYDAGPKVDGVTSVEGRSWAGLRWRLLVSSDADETKKQRLLVWLHPAGSSMNEGVAPLAAQWTKAGWALLLPTQKEWDSWSPADAEKLLNVTVPAVAKKVPALDVQKPVLVGYSAGGQMALSVWQGNAAALGGLVLDAAYPIDLAAANRGQIVPTKLPTSDAIRRVPFFVLVGAQDGGSSVWQQVESEWRQAGVPLTLEVIAGGKHEWLLREKQSEALLAWLADVAAGKLPGQIEQNPPGGPGGKKK